MTLLQYEVFKTIVDTGSFTKAGDALGLTQSAVSHAIRGLETELNLTLLNRGRTGVTLTSEGERIIDYVREILNLTERMKQEAGKLNGLEVGTLSIGTFPSASANLLPGIIEKFQSEFPAINIKFHEGGYDEIKKMILSGKIEIGFLPSSDAENVDFIPLFDDHLRVILPENHRLKNKKKLSIHEIASEPFIMPKAGCDELIKGLFKKNKVQPNIYCEIADNQTIIAMVQKNLGISIVPEMVIRGGHNEHTIAQLKEECYRTVGLALASRQQASPAVRAFIELTTTLANDLFTK
ncbi:LysR family transcriptional regulator [Pseudalkalibacillus decolorationis]|uniref:LysR family transcriptional regulator n=1 Tax=Pseudalkalibacillus decolorationis TaxID=163879 RepID=UPI00214789FC|nr:LysR family transcriptional regulator [Pseudalkalibacillus decolorationis]